MEILQKKKIITISEWQYAGIEGRLWIYVQHVNRRAARRFTCCPRYKSNPIWPSWDWLVVWDCNRGHSVKSDGRWNFWGMPVIAKNTVFMIYPKHYWTPYWLFTMVYARVSHFNLRRGHKHLCSFQLCIALNLKSTRHYVGIDMAPYVKSHTSAQHNCKTWEV